MSMPTAFERLPLGAVRPRGWLHQQMTDDLNQGFTGQLDTLTPHASRDLFKERIESSEAQYAWWDAETRGNWLWGYVWMAFLSENAEHQARAERLVRDLLMTQDADGYLGIYSPQSRYQHGSSENGELWAQSRALLALLTYYEFTGDDGVLSAVERAARLTMAHYGPGRSHFQAASPLALIIGMTHGLCYVDVMAWLYALTGDPAYRDFGLWLYEDFCALPVPFANDDLSTRSLLDPNRPFGGHAVHTAEQLRVLGWAAAVSGREDLLGALAAARTKFSRYTLPSGALMGDEGLHGMPNAGIGYEYCTTTEYLTSLGVLMQAFGTNGDDIERLTFNAAQGARLPDGRGLAYLSQDTRLDARTTRPDSYSHFHGTAGRFKFSPTHEDIACCCNPNSGRLLPQYIGMQWLRLTDTPGVAALLYGACELSTQVNTVNVRIEEVTDYPFEDGVRFVVHPERSVDFRLCLRQPEWAVSTQIAVNGGAVVPLTTGAGLLAIDRTWSEGDTVEVTFTPALRLLPWPEGTYAVVRGPLQYVLPIAPTAHPVKTYTGSALVDVEFTPQSLTDAYRAVLLDAAKPNYGLSFETIAGAERSWYTPSVRLVGDGFVLWPMGNTILRRADFPLKMEP